MGSFPKNIHSGITLSHDHIKPTTASSFNKPTERRKEEDFRPLPTLFLMLVDTHTNLFIVLTNYVDIYFFLSAPP